MRRLERVTLDALGFEISALGFGCGGLMQSPSRTERMGLLRAAVESGITHFDTARMYGLGMAETELGVFVRTVGRDTVTIATKFGIHTARNAQLLGRIQRPARSLLRKVPAIRNAVKRRDAAFAAPRSYTPADAASSLEQSLRALNTDYVDILFLHAPRPTDAVDCDGLAAFFEHAKQEGKIRAWGVSQDEGTEVDIAGRFGSSGVSQLLCSVVNPLPRPVDIAFGVFNAPYSMVCRSLASDNELLSHWRKTLGLEPLAPGVLSNLIMGSSRAVLNSRAVLYSSTKQDRITEAATGFSTPVDSAVQSRFAVLAQELEKGDEPDASKADGFLSR